MRWRLVDDALPGPHEVGRYWTRMGALRAAGRLEDWLWAHPGEDKGLPRAKHRAEKVRWRRG